MKRLNSASVVGGDGSAQSMSYRALFGEIYNVIPVNSWAEDGDTVVATFSCRAWSCLPNEYKTNDKCNKCPADYRSNAGASSILQCWACPVETYLSHPHATECSLDNRAPAAPVVMPVAPPVIAPVASPVASPIKAPVASPVSSPVADDDEYYSYNDDSPDLDKASPTKRPTPFPSVEPSRRPSSNPVVSECEDNALDRFLLKIKNGSPIWRKCGWLATRGASRQAKECANNASCAEYSPARAVCLSICGTCAGVDLTELESATFFLRMKTRNGIKTPVKKSCGWLKSKSDARISNLCSKTKTKFGFGPPKDVCPITCA